MAATYHVDYERDLAGCWVGTVREVKGCHTQGRTIRETRKRIREAPAFFVSDSSRAKLVDNVQMPTVAKRVVDMYTAARERADRQAEAASSAARRAVHLLAGGKLHLSRRDAGEILGLSHQRVQQLLQRAHDRARRARAARRRA